MGARQVPEGIARLIMAGISVKHDVLEVATRETTPHLSGCVVRMPPHQRVPGCRAEGERHVVVVDPTGELARLLVRQCDRAVRLREAGSARSFQTAPVWLDSVTAWRLETARILAAWFDRAVVTEFTGATSAGQGGDGLAERVRCARNALRNGTELVSALYGTQAASRRGLLTTAPCATRISAS